MEYDVVVIGSGPGGYVGAIRAAQLGFKTAIIEKYPTLGGTCLNVGCIPSKALLDSSEKYHEASKAFKDHGISCKDMSIDINQMIKRKNDVVKIITQGVKLLMKQNKIDVFEGIGSFVDAHTIKITLKSGEPQTIKTKNTVIATGSKPSTLPNIKIDKSRIISSTEALNLEKLPLSLVVVGGGAIGLEMASVFARLGTKVSVVEYLDSIIPLMDKDLGQDLQRILRKELKIDFYLGCAVSSVETPNGSSVVVKATKKDGESLSLEGEYCLMATGRRPYFEGLGLEKINLTPEKNGRLAVNQNYETKTKNVFAIGDVVHGPMLAHKAEEEGVFVAEHLAGQKAKINHALIPSVVYTWPEVASVGKTETELKKENHEYKVGKFPFRASGRARASSDIEGFIKVLADKLTDKILGVHMIGPRAADMIGEAVVAMRFEASAEDIGRICHPHPTFSEALKEAALTASNNRAIHI